MDTKQILKLIGIGFGLAALVVVIVALLLPGDYTFSREVVVQAPPQRIHELTGDLGQWSRWAPWLRTDPSLVTRVDTLAAGLSGHLSWQSSTGSGEVTITSCRPDSGLAFDLALNRHDRPSSCNLRYLPAGGGTLVVWRVQGNSGGNPLARYFNLLAGPLLGPTLEEGLARIKILAEESTGTGPVAGKNENLSGKP